MKSIKNLLRKTTSSPVTTRVTGSISVPNVAGVQVTREWQDEKDNVIHYGDQIAIRVCDGSYWQVKIDEGSKIVALERHVREWEYVKIVNADDEFVEHKNRPVVYGETIALKFLENKSFVGANLSGELTANVPWVKAWEKFTLLEHPTRKPLDKTARYGGWFALRAHNGKNVMFDKDNSKQLLAAVTYVDEWESFVFIHPSSVE